MKQKAQTANHNVTLLAIVSIVVIVVLVLTQLPSRSTGQAVNALSPSNSPYQTSPQQPSLLYQQNVAKDYGSIVCDIPSPLSTSSVCGNRVLESGEGCDDGNTNSYDGCSSLCTDETCTFIPDTGKRITDGYAPEEYDPDVDGIYTTWRSSPQGSSLGDIYVHNLQTGVSYKIVDPTWFPGVRYYRAKILVVEINSDNSTPLGLPPGLYDPQYDVYVAMVGTTPDGRVNLYLYSLTRNKIVMFPTVIDGSVPHPFDFDIGGLHGGLCPTNYDYLYLTWIETGTALGQTDYGNLMNTPWLYRLSNINWDSLTPIDRSQYILVHDKPDQGSPKLDHSGIYLVWGTHEFTTGNRPAEDILVFLISLPGGRVITINGQLFYLVDQSRITRLTSDAARAHIGNLAVGDGTVVYIDRRANFPYSNDLYLIEISRPRVETPEVVNENIGDFDIDNGILTYIRKTVDPSGGIQQTEMVARDVSTDRSEVLHATPRPPNELIMYNAISWPNVVWSDNYPFYKGDPYCYVLPNTI